MSNFLETYLELANSRKGGFVKLESARPLKMRAAFKNAPVMKVSTIMCRCGVEYDNQKDVIAKRESGELPSENAGLPWGEWLQYPFLITHKGETYLRFSTAKGENVKRYSPIYIAGNKVITKEEAETMALASEFASKPDGDVFTMKLCNIKSIKVNGETVTNG